MGLVWDGAQWLVDDASITAAKFAGAALVTEAEGLASSDNDTSIPTVAAVKDAIDTAALSSVSPKMRADFRTMSAIETPTTGGTATLTWSRTGSSPVLSSGRYISSDFAANACTSHWTVPLPDASRIVWARATFEMLDVGNTDGEEFVIVFWESNLNAGLLGDMSANRAPAHVIFYPTGWLVQYVDTNVNVVTVGSAYTYPDVGGLKIAGCAAQTVTVELDLDNDTLYVTGADGVRDSRTYSQVSDFPCNYVDFELWYTAANTDNRVKVIEACADSVIRH